MSELISVTSETVDATFPELPRMVRLALGFGSKLQHGTLDVTLADGRTVRLGGNGPGPWRARSASLPRASGYLRRAWALQAASVRASNGAIGRKQATAGLAGRRSPE